MWVPNLHKRYCLLSARLLAVNKCFWLLSLFWKVWNVVQVLDNNLIGTNIFYCYIECEAHGSNSSNSNCEFFLLLHGKWNEIEISSVVACARQEKRLKRGQTCFQQRNNKKKCWRLLGVKLVVFAHSLTRLFTCLWSLWL